MRKNKIAAMCVGLAIAVLTSLALAGNPETKDAKSVTCKGKVVDEQGRPIAGVKVTLYEMIYDTASSSYEVKPGEQTTLADGTFSFSRNLKTDTYRYYYIVAEKEGLALSPAGWNTRADKELEIKLGPPKELAGVVVDEYDKPIADAQVSISMLVIGLIQEERGLSGPVAMEKFTVRTDAAGAFKFTSIPAEAAAEFLVRKPGRGTVSTYQRITSADHKLKYAAGQKDIKLVLPPEAKIEGVAVERGTNKPVAGVQMRCTNGRELGYSGPRQLVSKQDGTFSIDALTPDQYTLELAASSEKLADWVAEPVEVTTEAGKTKAGVKVELSKGGVLEVLVKDAVSKQPVEKAGVGLQHEASGRYVSVSSGKDGVARIRLLPGAYRMSHLYKPGYSQQRVQDTLTIEDGKTEHLEYDLAGMPKITGVVRNEKGAPIKGAKLHICPSGREDGVSDAEGKFEVECDPGNWPSSRETLVMFLVGRYEEENLAAAVQMEQDARSMNITLKPAVIFSGKVVDPNGKGIAAANVTIMLNGPRWGSSIGRDQKTADAQGKFEVKAVPSGQKYSLYVIADGYGQNRSAQIDSNDAVKGRLDVGNVELAVANLSVSGVVVDSDGKPVAGVSLYCSGDGQARRNTQSDTDGKFTLEKVCTGKIRISANKSGPTRLYGSIETEGGATGVKITIGQSSSSQRYEPKQPPSLTGKPLPELKMVGIDLPAAQAGGKMILVCFFDMQQRPSRNCITQLAKQAETLKEKGVLVAGVQASKMDQNALNEWAKKSNVPFPVGIVQGDEEKARFAWGVKSLPWLVLTDSSHVIRKEGFSHSNVDAVIEDLKNVAR